jgi:hypothetical protein
MRRTHFIFRGVSGVRAALFFAMALFVAASICLAVASPWALQRLDNRRIDWRRLSDIGQTYGAVSAIIAAVALLGVAASLVIQSREAKAAYKNAQRAHHTNILVMAMEDPRYMECWGPYFTEDFSSESQFTYVNLIVSQWHAEYQMGELSDALLEATASSVFMSEPGRRYWNISGSFWRDNYADRRTRRFYRILSRAYAESLQKPVSPPPAAREVESTAEQDPMRKYRLWLIALSIGCGAAAALAARSIRVDEANKKLR